MSNGREGKRPRLFRLPASRRRLRGDIDRELRFHIEGRIEELIASGLTRDQAEREVTRRFGGDGLPESLEHLPVEAEDVPMQPVGDANRSVREPVHDLDVEPVGPDPAEDDPPGGGS